MTVVIILKHDHETLLRNAAQVEERLSHISFPEKTEYHLWLISDDKPTADLPYFSFPICALFNVVIGVNYDGQALLSQVVEAYAPDKLDCIITDNSDLARLLLTQLAIIWSVPSFTQVSHILFDKKLNQWRVTRSFYTGHLGIEMTTLAKPCCVSLISSKYPAIVSAPCNEHPNVEIILLPNSDRVEVLSARSAQHNPLFEAKTVLILGQGISSQQLCHQACLLAKRLNIAIAATRPVVMKGWLPLSALVGVSGVTISPKHCIVIGASGGSAFYLGIGGSESIISINTDPDAPINHLANTIFVADAAGVINALNRVIENSKED